MSYECYEEQVQAEIYRMLRLGQSQIDSDDTVDGDDLFKHLKEIYLSQPNN